MSKIGKFMLGRELLNCFGRNSNFMQILMGGFVSDVTGEFRMFEKWKFDLKTLKILWTIENRKEKYLIGIYVRVLIRTFEQNFSKFHSFSVFSTIEEFFIFSQIFFKLFRIFFKFSAKSLKVSLQKHHQILHRALSHKSFLTSLTHNFSLRSLFSHLFKPCWISRLCDKCNLITNYSRILHKHRFRQFFILRHLNHIQLEFPQKVHISFVFLLGDVNFYAARSQREGKPESLLNLFTDSLKQLFVIYDFIDFCRLSRRGQHLTHLDTIACV